MRDDFLIENRKKKIRISLLEYLSTQKEDDLVESLRSVEDRIMEKVTQELLGVVETVSRISLTPGPQGAPGIQGKTPVAGVDYRIPKDGRTPTNDELISLIKPLIPDPVPGVTGNDGSPDTGAEIVSKINELPIKPNLQIDARHIKNLPISLSKKHIGRGTGSPTQEYDLSPFLDSVTKVFTVPANKRVLLITSSSTPFFFRPTVDYVVSGTSNTTLTFDSSIDASTMLQQGQSLGLLYVE